MTSRRAVDLVERLARPAKAGHAGTLDPLATGVLVVCVGAATRLIEYVQRMPKRYRATFLLGRQSPTEDIEGEVTELPDAPIPTLDEIAAAAGRFVGRIAQRPPAFSALKVAGRRAYKLARAGQPPQLAPRPVEIFAAEIKSYQYPELVMEVECGSGTYIRSLGRDLAESLGTAAVMSALVRTCHRRLPRGRSGRSPPTQRRQLDATGSSRRSAPSSSFPACNSRPSKSGASATDCRSKRRGKGEGEGGGRRDCRPRPGRPTCGDPCPTRFRAMALPCETCPPRRDCPQVLGLK